jgi:aryl-alcohol dehydrogenase-like predicted oxidoreductase
VKVSQLCLGAMMSGACGNADLSQAHRHDPDVDHEETLGARSGVIAWSPLNMGWLTRPGVTSAIVGPRTTEQLTDLLAGQDVVLDDATLDRIDELVAPGTNINPVDAGWTSPAPSPVARRR